MNIVNIRSPYVLTVGDYGTTHVSSKITISIYKKGTTPPVSGETGFYSISKSIASSTQRATYYNIANYVKEFISIISPSYAGYTCPDEDLDNWVFVDYKLYWVSSGGVTTLISGNTLTTVNGYNLYTNGKNLDYFYNLKVLSSSNQIKQIPYQSYSLNGTYLNAIISVDTYGQHVDAVYTGYTSNGALLVTTISVVNGGESRGIYNRCVPLSLYPAYDYYNSCDLSIKWYNSGSSTPSISWDGKTQVVQECKYTPIKCSFINRYGGWEFLNFFKAQSNSITVKGNDYKLNQNAFYYDTQIGQYQTMNINGRQTVKLNTGWVEENYSALIQDLLLSETILLDNKPVTLKTQSSDLKSVLKDKNINYELEFEYAYDLINNII